MLNGPIAINNDRITVPFVTATEVINRIYVVDRRRIFMYHIPNSGFMSIRKSKSLKKLYKRFHESSHD